MHGIYEAYPSKRHASAPMLRTSLLPRLREKIRHLLNTAYSARGGPERMNLDQWRDVEHEVEQKLHLATGE